MYGPKSVYKSTWFHLNDYYVSGFGLDLLRIIDSLNVVFEHDLGTKWSKFDFDFNFLEIKVYLSNSMYYDENGKMIVVNNDSTAI